DVEAGAGDVLEAAGRDGPGRGAGGGEALVVGEHLQGAPGDAGGQPHVSGVLGPAGGIGEVVGAVDHHRVAGRAETLENQRAARDAGGGQGDLLVVDAGHDVEGGAGVVVGGEGGGDGAVGRALGAGARVRAGGAATIDVVGHLGDPEVLLAGVAGRGSVGVVPGLRQ